MASEKTAYIRHQMTAESMAAFIRMETDKGASANMLRRFNGTVKAVYDYLPEDKLLSRERLLDWRRDMEKQGYSDVTIRNYVKYINRYLDFVGCSEIRFNRGKAKDIAGMTFGNLTAIEPTGTKNRGDIVWKCTCSCGNTIDLPATRLLSGNTSSCGCLQKSHLKKVNKTFANTNLAQVLRDDPISTVAVSGYVGVAPKRDKWQAYIRYKGVNYFLGCYDDMEDAIKARARAKELVIEDATKLLEIYEELQQEAVAMVVQGETSGQT